MDKPMMKIFNSIIFLVAVTTNSFCISINSNDCQALGGFESSYYLNSSNQNAGTLPTARISGQYKGVTLTGTLTSLNLSGPIGLNTPTTSYYLAVKQPSANSTSEEIARFYVADTTGSFLSIRNNSSTNARFSPTVYGYSDNNATNALTLLGDVAGVDSGANPVFEFQARLGGAAVANRKLFKFSNYTTEILTVDKSGNFGINSSTPQRKLSVVGDIQCTGNLYVIGTSGALLTGQSKSIADNIATAFLDYTMPVNSGGAIFLDYTIVEVNGTTVNTHAGYISLTVRNQNGTITSNLVHPATLENDLGITADTLSVADGAGKATLSLQVNTTAATYMLYYNVRRCGSGTATPL